MHKKHMQSTQNTHMAVADAPSVIACITHGHNSAPLEEILPTQTAELVSSLRKLIYRHNDCQLQSDSLLRRVFIAKPCCADSSIMMRT